MKKGQEKKQLSIKLISFCSKKDKIMEWQKELVRAPGWCYSLGGLIYLYIQICFKGLKRCPSALSLLALEEASQGWMEKLPCSQGKVLWVPLPRSKMNPAFQPSSQAHVPFLHSQQGESSEISKSLCSAFERG